MQRLFYLAILVIVCLKRVATASWRGKNLCSDMQFKEELSANGSSPSNKVDSLDEGPVQKKHKAIYISSSSYDSVLYGTMATLSVHEFPTTKTDQGIFASILVLNEGRGDINAMHAGWAIDPSFYGDSETHFSVRWTADGYKSTGCTDLECDGFVPVNYAPITPGDSLEGKSKISIKVFKKKDDGDWWLYFGHDSGNIAPVGFWPKNLFNSLTEHANMITWGGYAGSTMGEPSPPMGNGQWPTGENSASFQDIQFVDNNGHGYAPRPWPAAVHSDVSHKNCYQVSVFANNMFYYGGPGCTD